MLRASRLMLAGACVVAIAPPTRNRVRPGIVRRNQRAVREFFFYRFIEFSRAKRAKQHAVSIIELLRCAIILRRRYRRISRSRVLFFSIARSHLSRLVPRHVAGKFLPFRPTPSALFRRTRYITP